MLQLIKFVGQSMFYLESLYRCTAWRLNNFKFIDRYKSLFHLGGIA